VRRATVVSMGLLWKKAMKIGKKLGGKGLERLVSERKIKAGWGAAVWLVIGLGLGFFFVLFQNCPPLVYVLETPIYRQKYCLVSKFGPSTFFFCKF